MKRTRVVLGVAFASSLFWLVGCGQGTYIPAVEPVVKPKPKRSSRTSRWRRFGEARIDRVEAEQQPPTVGKAPEKAPEAKPEEPKADATKAAAEPAKADAPKGDKAEAGKTAKPAAKPADQKPAEPKSSGKPKEKK
jgi:hypothetical protein